MVPVPGTEFYLPSQRNASRTTALDKQEKAYGEMWRRVRCGYIQESLNFTFRYVDYTLDSSNFITSLILAPAPAEDDFQEESPFICHLGWNGHMWAIGPSSLCSSKSSHNIVGTRLSGAMVAQIPDSTPRILGSSSYAPGRVLQR